MRTALCLAIAACLVTGVFWQTVDARPLSACEKGQLGSTGVCEDEEQDNGTLLEVVEPPEVVVPQHGTHRACNAFVGDIFFGTVGQLCWTNIRGPNTFANAAADCLGNRGRIADYTDWRHRLNILGGGVPVGEWLGPITADNRALFINLNIPGDFDGETSRFDNRTYRCVHERF